MLLGAGRNQYYVLYLLHKRSQYNIKNPIKADCRMTLSLFLMAAQAEAILDCRLEEVSVGCR